MIKKLILHKDFDLLIWIITIIELLLGILVIKIYSNVYFIEGLILIVLMQPFIYMWLVNGKKVFKFIAGILMILIPVIVLFTLPKYTYNAGKKIVKKSIGNVEFNTLKKGKNIVDVDDEVGLLIRKKYYKYQVNIGDETSIYIVSPSNGEIIKLEE